MDHQSQRLVDKRYAKLRAEEVEKVTEAMQQQVITIVEKRIQRKMDLEKAKAMLVCYLDYGYGFDQKWRPNEWYNNFALDRWKAELDNLTFANGAYRDNKGAVTSFSSGEPEVNIHNLHRKMLHGPHDVEAERRILKMLNTKKHPQCHRSLQEIEEEIKRFDHNLSMMWPHSSPKEREIKTRELMKLEQERETMLANALVKGKLWKSLASKADLQKQIKAEETKRDEERKDVLVRLKKRRQIKREMKNAEMETMSFEKKLTNIRKNRDLAYRKAFHHK